ncbi:MAG: hypothetical protein HQ521_07440 [Bacteroidetes bacterium]|nr:hypothetical protein [Bacteroidota bacterium]
MKRIIFRISLAVLIIIGFYLIYNTLYIYPKYDGKNPLSVNNIESQTFIINSESDTVLVGRKGTLLKIYKNSFHYCNGEIVHGKVEVEFKEIVTENDLVLSGLTTTSNGKLLETAGMFYINVQQEDKQLCLIDNGRIGIVVPAKEINMQMKMFNGVVLNDTINWQNPVALLNNPDPVAFGTVPESFIDSLGMQRARYMAISLGIIGRGIPQYVDSLKQYYDSLYQEYNSIEEELYYVFETNNIGWINIDRFIEQNETVEVELAVLVNNNSDFQNTYIRLVFVDLQSSIDAFKNNHNQFVFGKSITSKVNLPIENKAIIIATAYKKGKPYYDLKEITISKNQTIELNLEKTTAKDLREALLKCL